MGTSAAASPPPSTASSSLPHELNQPEPAPMRASKVSSSSAASTSSSSRPDASAPAPPAQHQRQSQHQSQQHHASNVTSDMRRRGATTTHRGSLPSAFPVSGSASDVFGGSRSRSTRTAEVVVDRRLLQKYEEVNSEIARLSRLSRMEQNPVASATALSQANAAAPHANSSETQMLAQVNAELRKARRSSSQAIQSQKELIDKLERQEKGGFRRFFSLNKESKVERIKSKLCDKLSESVQVDEDVQRLERRSDALARTSLASSFNYAGLTASYSHNASYSTFSGLQSVAEVEDEIASLEREKEDILNNLFTAIKSPDVQELHSRIALYSSEIHACQSIKKQVDRCATMYRQALQLLSAALATVVSPHYTGTVREFTQGPYPLAIEASHLIEAAAHGIQPESRRRYQAYAPELVGVQAPKFPQAVSDYARRARANVDPNSSLSLEALRKLRAAENVLMLLQRMVIEKSEVIDAWKKRVEQDQEQAERGHERLEKRLHEQVAVLARSVSV